MAVGVAISWDKPLTMASMPTGSGKSWILLMLALYYKNAVIIVPNEDL